VFVWRQNESEDLVRVLDLGCGTGCDLSFWGITQSDQIVGLDIDIDSLLTAKQRFPVRPHIQGTAESLPFINESFEHVVSAVAMPYMKIPVALREIQRTLAPGGRVSLSLHLPSFTLRELTHNAFPRPIATLFRLYVLANGLWFHLTGKTAGFLKNRTESCQTERGMRIALNRAGFVSPSFSRKAGPAGEMFFVEARRA